MLCVTRWISAGKPTALRASRIASKTAARSAFAIGESRHARSAVRSASGTARQSPSIFAQLASVPFETWIGIARTTERSPPWTGSSRAHWSRT